ncbi:Hypothetical protein A7982_03113 [Minicystis rosea]|nr:Hypothetical protein A7982_03113 [Minicystis rosea]
MHLDAASIAARRTAAHARAMTALPYDMFDLERSAADARRFERVENIYHRGQDLAWSGRDVLASLVKKHGGTRVPPAKKEALRQIFGPVLWGELAAWKISAQLADRLEPLEAKMAATSQAHDEARHFYVMHDYLTLATGGVPRGMHPASERLLSIVLETDDLAHKLLGMQLQVETTALTVFQHAREVDICPVLSELLPYFEKDEARHVGLGTQVLPILMRRMNRIEAAQLTAFALRVTFWLLASNRAMEPGLRTLGLDPRRVLTLAKSKQMIVWEELWQATNKQDTDLGDLIARGMEAIANGMWPPDGEQDLLGRARAVWSGLRGGVAQVPTTIAPDA